MSLRCRRSSFTRKKWLEAFFFSVLVCRRDWRCIYSTNQFQSWIFRFFAKQEILELSLSRFTLLIEVAHFSLRTVFVRAAFRCFGASFRAPREMFFICILYSIHESSTLMFRCKLDENEMGDFCMDVCLRVMFNKVHVLKSSALDVSIREVKSLRTFLLTCKKWKSWSATSQNNKLSFPIMLQKINRT